MFKKINYISQRFSKPTDGRFLQFARAVALVSVVLAVLALLISLSILEGFERELRSSAVKFTSHIVVNTINKKPIQNADSIKSLIKSTFKHVKYVAKTTEREGLAKFGESTEGVLLRSYNKQEDITNFQSNFIQRGLSFSSDSASEVIISKRLASKLGTQIGNKLLLYALKDQAGSVPDATIGVFEIIGFYNTGMAQYDDVILYLPSKRINKFLKFDQSQATKIEIMLNDINSSSGISKQIMELLGFPFWTMTYYELHSSIFAWIELQKEPIPLVLSLIAFVAVLNIVTTLLITVVEKTHSIGIMRTLGMKRRAIVAIFVYDGLRIGILGITVGVGLSLLFSLLQRNFNLISLDGEIYFLDSLPVAIVLWHYLAVAALTLFLTFLSTLLPALIASSVAPLRAIRFK